MTSVVEMVRMTAARLVLCLLIGTVACSPVQGAESLQEHFDRVAKEIEPLVGIELNQQVPVQNVGEDEYRKILFDQVEPIWPKSRRDRFVRSMQLLGLFDDKFVFDSLLDLTATAASASYDPDMKTIQVMLVPGKPGWDKNVADDTVFHELVHAAQDQRHDFNHTYERLKALTNTDAMMAFRFLMEGEAVFWPVLRRRQMTLEQALNLSPETQTDVFGSVEPDTSQSIVRSFSHNAAQNRELNKLASAMKQSPPLVVRLLCLPYTKGDNAVLRILKQGGRPALRQAFEDVSSLNTRDLLFPPRENEPPRTVTRIELGSVQQELGSQWKLTYEDTIGALALDTMFEHLGNQSAEIARSWNGDRIQLWESDDDGVVLTSRLEFETTAAAKRFETELVKLAREKWLRGKTIREVDSDGTHLTADGHDIIVQRRDQNVIFLRSTNCNNLASAAASLWRSQDRQP